MPIKGPQDGESKNDFISRCISEEVGKGHEQSQAVAMCINYWNNMELESKWKKIKGIKPLKTDNKKC